MVQELIKKLILNIYNIGQNKNVYLMIMVIILKIIFVKNVLINIINVLMLLLVYYAKVILDLLKFQNVIV